jgi:hypothetical protein
MAPILRHAADARRFDWQSPGPHIDLCERGEHGEWTMLTRPVLAAVMAIAVHAAATPAVAESASVSVTFDNRTTMDGIVAIGSHGSQINGDLAQGRTGTFTIPATFLSPAPRMPGVNEDWFSFGFQINDPQHICYVNLSAFRRAAPPPGPVWCLLSDQVMFGGECGFELREPSPTRCEVHITIR